jgi:hypothetical protein
MLISFGADGQVGYGLLILLIASRLCLKISKYYDGPSVVHF